MMTSIRRLLMSAVLSLGIAQIATAANDDYVAQWGPALGSPAPELMAEDQSGRMRTLDDLAGEHGLLILFNRSADW